MLDDLCIWTVKAGGAELTWTEVEHTPESKWPCARFSHSAVVWQDRKMIVSGGLSVDVLPLSDIWCYSMDTRTWHQVSVHGMLPRYSHTSSVYGNKLILMGGVNISPRRQPGVCVLNLLTQTCIEYALPVSIFKYHVSCTDEMNYFNYLFSHRLPTHKLCFLSCRPFVVNATFSTGLVVPPVFC